MAEPTSRNEASASGDEGRLAVFVPIDRRHALSRGEPLPDRVHGAVLLADISGFTPLTRRLREVHGPKRTAEEITSHLNRVFGALIEEIHDRRGSVISYSGDAITCWFRGDDGRRAVAAAVAMSEAMSGLREIAIGQARFSISLKSAVVAGETRRFLVGDPDVQCLDVLAGRPVDRVAAALDVAGAAEILAGAEVAAALGDDLVTAGERRSHDESFAVVTGLRRAPPADRWPDAVSLPDDRVRPWCLARIAERIATGGHEFLAEVRPVVAVFVRFAGIDYEDDRGGTHLDSYIRSVQAVVNRYEGDLLELTIGDKGSYLYIVFGATVAHEDDVRRAVAAARQLAVLAAGGEGGPAPQIGISSGEMRVGAYGGARRLGFGVQGREANVAARLMMKADPGEVLVTQRIADAVSGRFQVETRGAMQLKGVDEPIPVHAVIAAREDDPSAPAVRSFEGALIGRERERAALLGLLDGLAAGRSSAVVIEGSAGIGKSRLLADLTGEAARRGLRVLHGSAEQVERSTPLHAWRRVIRDAVRVGSRDDEEAVRERLLGLLGDTPETRAALPLLNVVLPLRADETAYTRALTGTLRADRTIELLVTLLDSARSGSPVVLALEDAHWMDPLSLKMMLATVDRLERCLVATAARDDSGVAELDALGRHESATRLTLGVLEGDAILALVRDRLEVDAIPRDLARFVEAKAEGQPFFAEEIAFALRDAGMIEISDRTCRMAPGRSRLDELNFPGTVQGVITSRLDRIPATQRLVLKVASVIGRVFPFVTLDHSLPDGTYPEADRGSRLAADLDELDRLDITPAARPEPDLAYMFRHNLVRDVVYGALLTGQRRQLHRSVARWYEEFHADDLSPHVTILAHHWREVANADDADPEVIDKAVGFLREASAQTTHSGMPLDAVEFGRDAARLLGFDLPTLPEDAAGAIGAAEEAIRHRLGGRSYTELIEQPRATDARSARIIEVLLEIMPAAFMARRAELFALAAASNLLLTLEHGHSPAAPVVYAMYAILRRNVHQDREGAHELSRLAIALDRKQGGHTFPIVAFIHTWFIDFWINPLKESLPLSLRAGRAGLERGEPLYGCYCLSGHVLYSAVAGCRLDDVKAAAREQIAAIDGRVLTSTFHCVLELQFAKALAGETRAVLDLTDDEYDEENDLASICETDQDNQVAYYHLARLKLNLYFRRREAALDHAERALALLPACAGQVAEMELRFFLALALLTGDDGDGAGAERTIDRAREDSARLREWSERCESNFLHKYLLVEAEIARLEGRRDDALRGCRAAAESARRHGYLQHEALALELEARLHALHGDTAAARSAFDAAAAAYERWGARAKADDVRGQRP